MNSRRFPSTDNEYIKTLDDADYEQELNMLYYFISRLDNAIDPQQIEYFYVKVLYSLYMVYHMKMYDAGRYDPARSGHVGTCKAKWQ